MRQRPAAASSNKRPASADAAKSAAKVARGAAPARGEVGTSTAPDALAQQEPALKPAAMKEPKTRLWTSMSIHWEPGTPRRRSDGVDLGSRCSSAAYVCHMQKGPHGPGRQSLDRDGMLEARDFAMPPIKKFATWMDSGGVDCGGRGCGGWHLRLQVGPGAHGIAEHARLPEGGFIDGLEVCETIPDGRVFWNPPLSAVRNVGCRLYRQFHLTCRKNIPRPDGSLEPRSERDDAEVARMLSQCAAPPGAGATPLFENDAVRIWRIEGVPVASARAAHRVIFDAVWCCLVHREKFLPEHSVGPWLADRHMLLVAGSLGLPAFDVPAAAYREYLIELKRTHLRAW